MLTVWPWEEEVEYIRSQYQMDSNSDLIQPLKKRLRITQDHGKELSNSPRDMHAPIEPLIEEPRLLDIPSNDGGTLLKTSCSVDYSCDPNIAEDAPDSGNDNEDLSPLPPLTLPPPSPGGPNQRQVGDQAISDSIIHESNGNADREGRDQPSYDPDFPDFPDTIDFSDIFSKIDEFGFGPILSFPESEKEESSIDPFVTPKHHDVAKDQSNDEEQESNTLDADANLALGTHHTASDRAAAPTPSSPKYTHAVLPWSGIVNYNRGRYSDSDHNDKKEKQEVHSGVENPSISTRNDRLSKPRAARKARRNDRTQKTSQQFDCEAPISESRARPEAIDREELVPLSSVDEVENESPTDPTFPGAWL